MVLESIDNPEISINNLSSTPDRPKFDPITELTRDRLDGMQLAFVIEASDSGTPSKELAEVGINSKLLFGEDKFNTSETYFKGKTLHQSLIDEFNDTRNTSQPDLYNVYCITMLNPEMTPTLNITKEEKNKFLETVKERTAKASEGSALASAWHYAVCWPNDKDKIDEILKANSDKFINHLRKVKGDFPGYFTAVLAHYKVLDPENAAKVEVTQEDWERIIEDYKFLFRNGGAPTTALNSAQAIKILQTDQVKITAPGKIEFINHPNITEAEKPGIPEERQF